ncbi:choice-of-anchor Q domain-containing protein [Singulisphaera sp. Ch08]|uniref:Choice-of-anchor Q domain-containing protein n=1 Tax=Singulisphaera sp. Ch08 TaxID=3120278 RepID=A0AAU7CTP9_9BACT
MPWLGPPRDNGGPTFIHSLRPGSPALDIGSVALDFADVTTDERGDGQVDLGADQVQVPTVRAGQAFPATSLLFLQRGYSAATVQADTPDPAQGLSFAIPGITNGHGARPASDNLRIDAQGRVIVASTLGDGFVVTEKATVAGFRPRASIRSLSIVQRLLEA